MFSWRGKSAPNAFFAPGDIKCRSVPGLHLMYIKLYINNGVSFTNYSVVKYNYNNSSFLIGFNFHIYVKTDFKKAVLGKRLDSYSHRNLCLQATN